MFCLYTSSELSCQIWIFTEDEGDGIKSRLPFKIFSTLSGKNELFIFDIANETTRLYHLLFNLLFYVTESPRITRIWGLGKNRVTRISPKLKLKHTELTRILHTYATSSRHRKPRYSGGPYDGLWRPQISSGDYQATGTWHWSTFVLGIWRSPRSFVRNPPCHLRRLRVWHKIWNWSRLRLCFPR